MSLLGVISSIGFFLSADYSTGREYNHICTIEMKRTYGTWRYVPSIHDYYQYQIEKSPVLESVISIGCYMGTRIKEKITLERYHDELTW